MGDTMQVGRIEFGPVAGKSFTPSGKSLPREIRALKLLWEIVKEWDETAEWADTFEYSVFMEKIEVAREFLAQ